MLLDGSKLEQRKKVFEALYVHASKWSKISGPFQEI